MAAAAGALASPAVPVPLCRHRQQPPRAGRRTGASNAAGFLSRFVPDEGRAGCMSIRRLLQRNGDSLWAPGANTLGMRTIAHTLLAETR